MGPSIPASFKTLSSKKLPMASGLTNAIASSGFNLILAALTPHLSPWLPPTQSLTC